MEKLGVLGGMGPESTALFLSRVIARTDASCDAEHIPALVLNDTLVPDRTAALLGEGVSPLPALQKNLDFLAGAGCTVIASPCNTAHAFFPQLRVPKGVLLLDMVREALHNAPREKALCVLGTTGLCRARVYENAADENTRFLPLSPDRQDAVMEAITLVKAGRHETALSTLLGVMEEVSDALPGAKGEESGKDAPLFLLACTELSVLHEKIPARFDCSDALEQLAVLSVRACGYPLR